MSTRKPRTPTWTATVFGTAVFAALMMGVGGYQVSATDLIGTVIPRVDKDPNPYQSVAPPAGSAPSMCPGWPAQDSDGDFSSMSTWSTRSPLDLDSVCN